MVIADDSVIVREGVGAMLQEEGLDVVGLAGDVADVVRIAQDEQPDLVILDLRMPPTHSDEGVQAARAIREALPDTGILVLSAHVDTARAASLLEDHSYGIGYMLKDRIQHGRALAQALERLAAGECVIDPAVVERLFKKRVAGNPLDQLTPTERSVLQLVAEGRSNRAIGRDLHMAERTVESHVSSILTRLGLQPEPDDHRRVLAAITYLRNIDRA